MLTLQESRDALLGVEQVTSGANHLMAKKNPERAQRIRLPPFLQLIWGLTPDNTGSKP